MKRRKPRYVVTKDGVDCGFAPPQELGLATVLGNGCVSGRTSLFGKRGVLVKRPQDPHVFGGAKSANRFIAIAERVANTFRGTLVDEMPKLQPLLERGKWDVRVLSP